MTSKQLKEEKKKYIEYLKIWGLNMLGIQEYDKEGKLICKICGKSFHRLIAHVRQYHKIDGNLYRNIYGFCKTYAFISDKSKQISREKVLNNPKIINNLVVNGKDSRFYSKHKKCVHIMTPQRKLIIEKNKSYIKIKPFFFVLLVKLSSQVENLNCVWNVID